ncbi:MAG: uracil-DNA glycosylase [Spirochaetales bacterium]|nr:uracil-DNA glycosylase [Spirochaetales bacterium]
MDGPDDGGDDGFTRETSHADHSIFPGSGASLSLDIIASQVASCRGCRLAETRNMVVPGEGVQSRPLVLIIGEAPGGDEDQTGHPFVGKAGKYLDKWLESIGLSRNTNCFIGNIIKCRPPQNRDPQPDEISACKPYLDMQIQTLRPASILTLGRIASQILIGSEEGIGKLRGKTYSYMDIPLIPTYHPSGVLRNPEYKRDVWDDLKRLRSLIDPLEQ